jgi:hypothetical protein
MLWKVVTTDLCGGIVDIIYHTYYNEHGNRQRLSAENFMGGFSNFHVHVSSKNENT